ncbi:hypothetical protein TNCV_3682251 [Trichonephila clavipes]|uniref:Uncharacterized protein n=1 Tax=Trichonephila clavipes TaxID=2585209 RepID=A0A8X6RFK7_TRICX|nr:hypothetical protein TNCV_3682251 [Trichonephila clavipes]
MQMTERFSLVSPQFRGRTPWGWSGAYHLSSPSTNLTRGLAARRLFKVLPCREGTMHSQISMSSPGFEPSPNGTAVSVANHYTGWATSCKYCSKPFRSGRRSPVREMNEWVIVNVALLSYTRAFGDGLRNSEQWSRDEDATPEMASPSPNYHTMQTGGRLCSRHI